MTTALFAFAATALLILHFVRNGAFPAVTLAGAGRTAAPQMLAPTIRIDDPRVAASAMFHAMLSLEGASVAQQRGLLAQLQDAFAVDRHEARQLALLGAWVANQFPNPREAVPVLSSRLGQLGGPVAEDQRRMAAAIFGASLPRSIASALPR